LSLLDELVSVQKNGEGMKKLIQVLLTEGRKEADEMSLSIMQKLTELDSKMEQKKVLAAKDFISLEEEFDVQKERWNQQLTESLNIFLRSMQETKQLISDLKANADQNNQLLKDTIIETMEHKFLLIC
jgi:hypothetical protein